jgi:hypothetical protein
MRKRIFSYRTIPNQRLKLQSRLHPKAKQIPLPPFTISTLFNVYIPRLANGLIRNSQFDEPFETLVVCRNGDEAGITVVL